MFQFDLIAGVETIGDYVFKYVSEFNKLANDPDEGEVAALEFVFTQLAQIEEAIFELESAPVFTNEPKRLKLFREIRDCLKESLTGLNDRYYVDYYWHLRRHYDEKLEQNMLRKAKRKRAMVTEEDFRCHADEVHKGENVYDNVYHAFLSAYDAGKTFIDIHEEVQRKVFGVDIYPAAGDAEELFGDVHVLRELMHYVAKRRAYTETIAKYKDVLLSVDKDGKLVEEPAAVKLQAAAPLRVHSSTGTTGNVRNYFKLSCRMQVTQLLKDFFVQEHQQSFVEMIRL